MMAIISSSNGKTKSKVFIMYILFSYCTHFHVSFIATKEF
jgi:hypothetical protein